MNRENRDAGPRPPDEHPQSADRVNMLINALVDEERILRSELADVRRTAGCEPHLVTQLTETLRRMLYLAEELPGSEDPSSRN